MRRERTVIPKPRSSFIVVQCTDCGNERVIFSHTTKDIKCNSCESMLAKKTGGQAIILGTAIRRTD